MSFWREAAFSSKTDDWATPVQTFHELAHRYGPFDLDVCASPENAKCARYYTAAENGLVRDWLADGPRCWMNPPYGETIGEWMAKALEESRRGCLVVCLVPARTDTAWWHNYAMKGEIAFLRGRLKFGDAKAPAPFPSAVVVFGGRPMTRSPLPHIPPHRAESPSGILCSLGVDSDGNGAGKRGTDTPAHRGEPPGGGAGGTHISAHIPAPAGEEG